MKKDTLLRCIGKKMESKILIVWTTESHVALLIPQVKFPYPVSSRNELHWGYDELDKLRNNFIGTLRCFPKWDLEELLMARPQLSRVLAARFRLVGGVPRHFSKCYKWLRNGPAASRLNIEAIYCWGSNQILLCWLPRWNRGKDMGMSSR